MVQFNILGNLEVIEDERACGPTAPKVNEVLALLLLRANHTVSRSAISEELWGNRPPISASTTIQTYIYHLRTHFDRQCPGSDIAGALTTRPPGYVLSVQDHQLDLARFERLTAKGRSALQDGQPGLASSQLRQALAVWRGPVLSNVHQGRLLEAHVVHLQEMRSRTQELLIEAEFEQGRHREIIGELRYLVAENPLDEWLHARLIDALSRSGRRADALSAYQGLRRILEEDLGLDPSSEVQLLHQQVLSA